MWNQPITLLSQQPLLHLQPPAINTYPFHPHDPTSALDSPRLNHTIPQSENVPPITWISFHLPRPRSRHPRVQRRRWKHCLGIPRGQPLQITQCALLWRDHRPYHQPRQRRQNPQPQWQNICVTFKRWSQLLARWWPGLGQERLWRSHACESKWERGGAVYVFESRRGRRIPGHGRVHRLVHGWQGRRRHDGSRRRIPSRVRRGRMRRDGGRGYESQVRTSFSPSTYTIHGQIKGRSRSDVWPCPAATSTSTRHPPPSTATPSPSPPTST